MWLCISARVSLSHVSCSLLLRPSAFAVRVLARVNCSQCGSKAFFRSRDIRSSEGASSMESGAVIPLTADFSSILTAAELRTNDNCDASRHLFFEPLSLSLWRRFAPSAPFGSSATRAAGEGFHCGTPESSSSLPAALPLPRPSPSPCRTGAVTHATGAPLPDAGSGASGNGAAARAAASAAADVAVAAASDPKVPRRGPLVVRLRCRK
jgi:hypothetical protein